MTLQDDLKGLQAFLAECREDMHEPDEQEIRKAELHGEHLDNAIGIMPDTLDPVCGEQLLTIHKDTGEYYTINVCNLLALARKATL